MILSSFLVSRREWWGGVGRESWGCGVGTVRLTRRCTCPGLCAALLNYPTLADRVFSRLLTLIFLCELYFGFLSHVEGKSVFPSASHHHPPPTTTSPLLPLSICNFVSIHVCDFYQSSFFYFYKKKTDTRTFTKVVIKVTDIQSHTKVCVLRLYTCINREGSVNSSSTIRHCPSHLDFFFWAGGMLLLLQSA